MPAAAKILRITATNNYTVLFKDDERQKDWDNITTGRTKAQALSDLGGFINGLPGEPILVEVTIFSGTET